MDDQLREKTFAIFTSPIIHLVCPSRFCISIVFYFYCDHCNSQGEIKNKGYAKSRGANKLYYGRCANGEVPCSASFSGAVIAQDVMGWTQNASYPPHLERLVKTGRYAC